MKQLFNVVAIGLAPLFLLAGTPEAPGTIEPPERQAAQQRAGPAAGEHTFTASYHGDGCAPSVSDSFTVVVTHKVRSNPHPEPTYVLAGIRSMASERPAAVPARKSGRLAEMFGYGFLASMGVAGVLLVAVPAYRSRRRRNA
ncbi:Ig-like domain-containing protein [Actinopolymorpha sp. B9G3]|uniref:Ig-like domain-containing protein n=1 Tax=Actinopolymorpha sp. B9G3 TaxID=3158970 RepID=UPI0032D92E32